MPVTQKCQQIAETGNQIVSIGQRHRRRRSPRHVCVRSRRSNSH